MRVANRVAGAVFTEAVVGDHSGAEWCKTEKTENQARQEFVPKWISEIPHLEQI